VAVQCPNLLNLQLYVISTLEDEEDEEPVVSQPLKFPEFASSSHFKKFHFVIAGYQVDWNCESVDEGLGKELEDLQIGKPLESKMPFKCLFNLISVNSNLKKFHLHSINFTDRSASASQF